MEREDIIFGYHSCKKYIANKADYINKVVIQRSSIKKYSNLIGELREKGIRVDIIEKSILDKIAKGRNHQGIIIYTSQFNYYDAFEVIEEARANPVFILIDGVEDPQNLGGIIRTAAATDVDGIIIEQRRCSQITSTVMKVSSGALSFVKVAKVSNIKNIIPEFSTRNIPVVATDVNGKTIWTEVDYNNGVAFILGNENRGVRRILIEKSDYHVRIPLSNKIESLNVSVACGILLYEVVRQKMKKMK